MSASQFAFDTEFTLLDVGATGALVRSGGVRPAVLAYHSDGSPECVVLEWPEGAGAADAVEAARRWLRERRPLAYGFVSAFTRADGAVHLIRSGDRPGDGAVLGLVLRSVDGAVQEALYPIRIGLSGATLGVPISASSASVEWCPIGDIWTNPFCIGDTVRFRPPERAVDPSSALWKSVVELTKLRVQSDLYKSSEYMLFLEDLRNGLFTVAARAAHDPMEVVLRTRTVYNPLGFLVAHASKLVLANDEETTSGDRES
ncbi:MAG: hypothetical protein HUU17_07780 [Chthonomonadales bacterium]|nr:hypothetical protein [Chthonomonadales bacterium]